MSDHDHHSREFWDAKYTASHRIWSGRPNLRLVELVDGLPPADAVDAGCGEGADAIWLARQGWRVTGLDLSQVALDRAARHARDAGVEVDWRFADLVAGDPVPEADLVTAQFLHVPPELFDRIYRDLASAVRPGGSLVVAGHHPDDPVPRNPELTRLLFAPEQVTAVLDPAEWEVRVAAAPTREVLDHDGAPQLDEAGRPVWSMDTLVHAVRRG